MKRLLFILTCCLSLSVASPAYAEQDSKPVQTALSQLMQAISDNDYDAFTSSGTPLFRKNVTKQSFESVRNQLGELIRAGYSVEYVSELYQKGNIVHVWKISYAKSKENSLAKLILIEDKVAGFWLF